MTDDKQLQTLVEHMWQLDHFSQGLGMKLGDVAPGKAVVTLAITEQMLNGFGVVHGGVIFSLADTAFAFACNSDNNQTVALSCTISYSAPALAGDNLTAVAVEQSRTARTGVYDISISNQRQEVIALFRGIAYRTRDKLLQE